MDVNEFIKSLLILPLETQVSVVDRLKAQYIHARDHKELSYQNFISELLTLHVAMIGPITPEDEARFAEIDIKQKELQHDEAASDKNRSEAYKTMYLLALEAMYEQHVASKFHDLANYFATGDAVNG